MWNSECSNDGGRQRSSVRLDSYLIQADLTSQPILRFHGRFEIGGKEVFSISFASRGELGRSYFADFVFGADRILLHLYIFWWKLSGYVKSECT